MTSGEEDVLIKQRKFLPMRLIQRKIEPSWTEGGYGFVKYWITVSKQYLDVIIKVLEDGLKRFQLNSTVDTYLFSSCHALALQNDSENCLYNFVSEMI